MKKLNMGFYSALALLALSACGQSDSATTTPAPTTGDSAQVTTTQPENAVEETAPEEVEVLPETTEIPPLGPKPASVTQVETVFMGELYDIYQGQSEKMDIEDFTLSEDGKEVEGGEITEWTEDYLSFVLLHEEKTTTFYVTEETTFNEEAKDKEAWLGLLMEANEAGLGMYPTRFDMEITYSEDEFANKYIDSVEINEVEQYADGETVDISSLEFSDTDTVKIRYIFAVGDDLMTITTFTGERSDESGDVEYRITDSTGFSSLDSAIVDAQVKDAILTNGSNLSEDLELVCNLYWNEGDTHNDYQNLLHIELVSLG